MILRQRPSSLTRGRGFTLVEVLATMTLMGIALPVLMNGISVASHCADVARHRSEAAALAESQLTEIVATGNWQPGASASGDFSPDWPEYRWQSTVSDWTQNGLEQIDLHVTWKGRDGDRDIVLSTLVYNNINAGTGTTGSTGTTSTGSTGSGGTGAKAPSGGGK
jgi:prepilin-type N-terminal cleavage/methylation domain-containing protein